MNSIQDLNGVNILKIILYQRFCKNEPPTLEQQDVFYYCENLLLWLSDEKAIHIGSYMTNSSESCYACSIAIRRLIDLPYSWQSDRERLLSCEDIKEVTLDDFENSTITSVAFYGRSPVIQSLEIHFNNGRQIHIFSGDCYEEVNGKLKFTVDDEWLFAFCNESDYKKYNLQHGKPI